ncbi:Transcription factor MYB3R-5 [Hondaea fermentalgiana]|uniref:Transcription factor MYB3R-5 n=1 Tax=Hondaea fermentalgiana TaxID=2315210 RepID=A0A2R5G408_9STRA|nr:Transcription factor MYB3R-5 [Hondaea fermentalgiana]|eukprot:GBG25285.1 Transcription factor MYB3R-5 [Hondaea fermentalgiana]
MSTDFGDILDSLDDHNDGGGGGSGNGGSSSSAKRKMMKGYSGRGIQDDSVTARLRDMNQGSFRSGRPTPIHQQSGDLQEGDFLFGADDQDLRGLEPPQSQVNNAPLQHSDSAPPAPINAAVHGVSNSPADLRREPEPRRSGSSFGTRVSNGVSEIGRMLQDAFSPAPASSRGEKVDRRSDLNRVAAKPRHWTTEEDEMLRKAVEMYGEKQWKKIAEFVPGRNNTQCLQRWSKVLTPGLKKGMWSEDEDNLLLELAQQQLQECRAKGKPEKVQWGVVKNSIPGRTAKQCRERWVNNLNPVIRRDPWTEEEDARILQLYESMPKKWAAISKHLPGRTENAVKVRWKSLSRDGGASLSRSSSSTPRSPISAPPSPASSHRSNSMPFQQHAMQQHAMQQQRSMSSEYSDYQSKDLMSRMDSFSNLNFSDDYAADDGDDDVTSPLAYGAGEGSRGYSNDPKSISYMSMGKMLEPIDFPKDGLSPMPMSMPTAPTSRPPNAAMGPPRAPHLGAARPVAAESSYMAMAPPTTTPTTTSVSAQAPSSVYSGQLQHQQLQHQQRQQQQQQQLHRVQPQQQQQQQQQQQASGASAAAQTAAPGKRPSLASVPMGGAPLGSGPDSKSSIGSWRNSGNFGNLWNDPIATDVHDLIKDMGTSGRGSSFMDGNFFESSGNLDVPDTPDDHGR